MKNVLVLLFMLFSACAVPAGGAPETPLASPLKGGEQSPLADSNLSPVGQTGEGSPASAGNNGSPALPDGLTEAVETAAASLTQVLFGTATPTEVFPGLKVVFTSAESGGLKCNVYNVDGTDYILSTDPATCSPLMSENDTLWGKIVSGSNKLMPLLRGLPDLADLIHVDMAKSSANGLGFGMNPTDASQGLQYMPVQLNYQGKEYTVLLWLTADAPQATSVPATDANGNEIEDGGSGGGGGEKCWDGSTPGPSGCPPIE